MSENKLKAGDENDFDLIHEPFAKSFLLNELLKSTQNNHEKLF